MLSQICPQDTTKLLGSTDSNFGEWPQDFLCIFITYYFREFSNYTHKVIFHQKAHMESQNVS